MRSLHRTIGRLVSTTHNRFKPGHSPSRSIPHYDRGTSNPPPHLLVDFDRLSSQPGPQPKSQTNNQDDRKIPLNFSYHWDTLPPTAAQLKHASTYFQRNPAKFLWSAPKFHSMDFGSCPEVAFLGRSNVGKSSLLNALISSPLAHTSSKRGRTRAMNAYSIGAANSTGNDGRRLIVMDMPGYGKGGQEEWGKEIMKYLEKRKQLTRAFVLIDSEYGLKPTDKQILSMLREKEIPHQVVLAKADKPLLTGKGNLPAAKAFNAKWDQFQCFMAKLQKDLGAAEEDVSGLLGEFIACSAEKTISPGKKLGIDGVQFAILRAAGMELVDTRTRKSVQEEIVPFDQLVWKDE